MPRRTSLTISAIPYQYKSKILCMKKCFTSPSFHSNTILTDDIFTYIEFYFSSHKKAMKYRDTASRVKYGSEKKYHYSFYWKQATTFYQAAKTLPIGSVPLVAYYSMLNAAKAFLAFKHEYIEDFVDDFAQHGLKEAKNLPEESLGTIAVTRKEKGVYPLFGNAIQGDFSTIWPHGANTSFTLKTLLYNLAYIHRAYITTYNTPRSANIPELFIPLPIGDSPKYYKGNDSNLYLMFHVDKEFFSSGAANLPAAHLSSISPKFTVSNDNNFMLRSQEGAKRNASDSLSADFKEFNNGLRQEFQYIRSNNRLWYLKRSSLINDDVINLNSMLITMAAMHRISEIVRYKPEQLAHLMDSKENWLIHEFITLALDQFIDEIAAEITGQEIMGTGINR